MITTQFTGKSTEMAIKSYWGILSWTDFSNDVFSSFRFLNVSWTIDMNNKDSLNSYNEEMLLPFSTKQHNSAITIFTIHTHNKDVLKKIYKKNFFLRDIHENTKKIHKLKSLLKKKTRIKSQKLWSRVLNILLTKKIYSRRCW